MDLPRWERVPYGDEAPVWNTFPSGVEQSVLLVVHNVTAATRLLDVLPAFSGDPRVGLAFTCPGSSPFRDGVAALFAEHGVVDLDWRVACEKRFGLAVTASHGGPLWELKAPVVVLPHGMGYNKYLDLAAEPSRAEPSRAEPSRAEPSRAEPSRAEPSRAEPSRAEPSRAEP
ncbi:hypothetical protein KGQ20_44295, partial [Catenulispora sp. NF23]